MPSNLPPIRFLRKALSYNPSTGSLFWKERTPDMFGSTPRTTPEQSCRAWNKRHAFEQAFTRHASGFSGLFGKVDGRICRAEDVAFALFHGSFPVGATIEHLDGNRWNTRAKNLRAAWHVETFQDPPLSKNNVASGRIGVSYLKNKRLWLARISVDGVEHHLGTFKNMRAAIKARDRAERDFGIYQKELAHEQRPRG